MNVLCVMAHPDDEVLGCGGTLAKHAANGDKVTVAIACARRYEGLEDQVHKAAEHLGVQAHTWGLPDQALDTLPFTNLLAVPEESEEYHGPADIIYTHHPADLNQDHSLIAKAVLTAFRPKPDEPPRTILACEVLSSTEWTFPQVFQPNWFVALESRHLSDKWAAMNMYTSEVQAWPHPRNRLGIEYLAHYRGLQCGTFQAEAFQLLRHGPA